MRKLVFYGLNNYKSFFKHKKQYLVYLIHKANNK